MVNGVLLFLFGLIIGSFLNCLIWRLNNPKAAKFWVGRSICPKCQHQLSVFDNIPLLSFIFLRGKCRYCHKNISWQYPVVELLTAITFTMTGLNPGILALECAFIVIFFSDLIYGYVPDIMIVLGILGNLGNLGNLGIGILTALPFTLFAKFGKMGYGDVTLAFLMGLTLGWPKIIVALWSGFVVGGVVAAILLVLKKTKLSATIPLGPFLIIGLVISALWSDALLRWLR